MRRGENIEQLLDKSTDMSKVSTEFYKKAKKANKSCCTIF